MVKFNVKNVSSRLSITVLDVLRNSSHKLFRQITQQDTSKFASITRAKYSELHDAVLKAECQKSLGVQYLETRKLTLV